MGELLSRERRGAWRVAVKEMAEQVVPVGHQAATVNACMGVWLSSYIVGITDGRPDRTLPEFEAL